MDLSMDVGIPNTTPTMEKADGSKPIHVDGTIIICLLVMVDDRSGGDHGDSGCGDVGGDGTPDGNCGVLVVIMMIWWW